MGNRKQPKAKAVPKWGKSPSTASGTPSREKRPRSLGTEAANAWHRRVVWRFAELDAGHPSAAKNLTAEQYRDVYAALGAYEQQTCAEIWGPTENGCHRYDLESAHANITDRLADLQRDDETAVHSLRINNKLRVHGLLRENIFHVLWLDPEHEMWPPKDR